jgi:hypothetical protein
MNKPQGVLTYCHNGVPDLEIFRAYCDAIDAAYKRGLRDGKKQRKEKDDV